MRKIIFPLAFVAVFSGWGAPKSVVLDVHPEQPGIAIPADFLGFSYEAKALWSKSRVQAENPVFQRLIKQIGPGVLRFGGTSVDKTGWQRAARTPATPKDVVVPGDVDRMIALARATGYRLLLGLNIGSRDAASAADEAAYMYQAGKDALYGFEIGNEPNLFSHNGIRGKDYTVDDYIAEYRTFASAIQARTPQAFLTGATAVIGNDGVRTWTAPFVQRVGPCLGMVNQHFYALGPPSSATIAKLLGDPARQKADSTGAMVQEIAQKAGLSWRMAETNSVNRGGRAGVSDVFAAALWSVDYMFTLAGHGAAGVNYHGGSSASYAAIEMSNDVASPRPLYYGLLLFHAAARGRMVPLDLKASGVNLTAYGVVDADGTLRVTVVNKDAAQDASVRIAPGAGYTKATAIRLTAASLGAKSGIAVGGAAVAADGSWTPGKPETVAGADGAFTSTVRAGSAALVTFSSDKIVRLKP